MSESRKLDFWCFEEEPTEAFIYGKWYDLRDPEQSKEANEKIIKELGLITEKEDEKEGI